MIVKEDNEDIIAKQCLVPTEFDILARLNESTNSRRDSKSISINWIMIAR